MADKKKKKRRDYLNDFKPDEKGKYQYSGNVYEYKGTEDLKKLHTLTVFLTAVIAVSLILAGLLPAPGLSDTWYVILPYLTAITNSFVLTWKYVRYRVNAKELREYVYEKTVKQFPLLTRIQLGFSALTAGTELLYLLLVGAGDKLMEGLTVTVAAAVSAFAAWIWMKASPEFVWKVKSM